MLQALINGPDKWLLLEAVSLHKCTSSTSWWSHHIYISWNFWWLTVDSAVVMCILQTLQFCCSAGLLFTLSHIAKPLFSFLYDDSKTKMKEAVWLSETTFYLLLVLELSGMIILYSRKELKTFTCNCHLNHKQKFTKVKQKLSCTLRIHFDRPYCSRILSPIYYVLLLLFS